MLHLHFFMIVLTIILVLHYDECLIAKYCHGCSYLCKKYCYVGACNHKFTLTLIGGRQSLRALKFVMVEQFIQE